jgi:Zn-dependent peptidase ImmA (M78 family)
MTIKIFNNASLAARRILYYFNVNKPEKITLDIFAVSRKIYPDEAYLPNCDGLLLVNLKNDTGLATINSSIIEPGKKRFALAHEIGHFELHRRKKRRWECTEADFLKWYEKSEEEPEANAFAAELLMPEDLFKGATSGKIPSVDIIKQLASEFKTSLTASAIRFSEIGQHPCAIFFSKEGKISWFRKNDNFQYNVALPGSNVDDESCAGAYFYNRQIPEGPQQVPDYCWLDYTGPANKIKVFEDFILLKRYDIGISVVWTP